MAQMGNSQTSQTLHVKSEQTLSAWFQKIPTQLNTPKRFVPELVQVSPNASDGQQLALCVLGFRNFKDRSNLTLTVSLCQKSQY